MSTLVICWDADHDEWVIFDDGDEVERFAYIADAAWFVRCRDTGKAS